LRDERLPSPRWESNGLSYGAGASVQPDSLSATRPACGSMGGGSRGRTSPYVRLEAQPANPDLGRVSVRDGNSAPLNSGECEDNIPNEMIGQRFVEVYLTPGLTTMSSAIMWFMWNRLRGLFDYAT